jgi:uncharacterized repeat protein (TIGR03803 family)
MGFVYIRCKHFYMRGAKLILVSVFIGLYAMCNAQYTELINFNNTSYPKGASPCGSVILSGKQLFGMTKNGGANDSGCIFSIDTNGNNYKDIFDFNGPNGAYPYGSLVLLGKKLYGMTNAGGDSDDGCIFSIDSNGANYQKLMDFQGLSTGKWTVGTLTYANGRLYGMTNEGGIYDSGCIFSIDTSGHHFKDLFDCTGPSGKWAWGDVVISGSQLFGMFSSGGADLYGTLFSLDTTGHNFKKMLDFSLPACALPQGSVILVGDKLYGMTEFGGTYGDGNIFSIDTNGTGYKNVFSFRGNTGNTPAGSLIISGGTLIGMTQYGGAHDSGSVFSVDTSGRWYTDLFDFNGTNGSRPYIGRPLLTGRTIFGMTKEGGSNHKGVLFKLHDNILSTNTISVQKYAVVYPNPSNGLFILEEFNYNPESENTLNVYNTLGEKIFSYRITNNSTQLDLNNQPNGIYFYTVTNNNQLPIMQGKLSIQK